MARRKDGWTDGRTDGWIDGWVMDWWVDGWVDREIDEWVGRDMMVVWTDRGISGRMREYLYKYFVTLESICFLRLFPKTGHLLKVSPSHRTWHSSAHPAANCSKAFYAFVLAQKAFHQKTETGPATEPVT